MRNVLITPEEVIFHAPTKHTLDPRMIETSIIVAEERFIKPELGFSLYNAIVEAKNVLVDAANLELIKGKLPTGSTLEVGELVNSYELLTPDLQKLWKQHLWKLTAECVITSAYPEGFVQFGSEGAFHNSPPAGLMVTSGFVTPLISSMKWSIDKKVKDRIAPLINSMHEYICAYIGAYPNYGRECPDCTQNEKKLKFTGLATDLYDDDDNERCCEPGWMKKT